MHAAGSVASLWQQAGRAGRREQASTSIYIAFDGPLDQYYFNNPDLLFGRPIEQSQVDPGNAQLMMQHVACAGLELPVLLEADQAYFGPDLPHVAHHLKSLGEWHSPLADRLHLIQRFLQLQPG